MKSHLCYSKRGDTMKQKKTERKTFGTFEVLLLLFLTCFLSFGAGFYLGKDDNKGRSGAEDENVYKFIENYEYIVENYYNKVDEDSLVDAAIKGMVESLGDEYSSFMTNKQSNSFDISLKGEYEGVGISVSKLDGKMTIVEVYEGTSASEAGVLPLDVITDIKGIDASTLETSDIVEMVAKEKGEIPITLQRGDETIRVSLKRKKIVLTSVHGKIIDEDHKIGYIKMDIFALNGVDQFKKELRSLEKQGMKSLIIDVRDNGGGHLSTAKEISSMLLDDSHVIYQTELKGKKTKVYSTGKETKKYPIVFLTNNGSASGSELLVASLIENTDARVVGQSTYGKGTVQELVPLSNGSEYKVTVKKWLTPKGNWLNENGIQPDFEVKLGDEYYQSPSDTTDNQLQKALEILK